MNRNYSDEGNHKPSRQGLNRWNKYEQHEPESSHRSHYETASDHQRYRSTPRPYLNSNSDRSRPDDPRNQYRHREEYGTSYRPEVSGTYRDSHLDRQQEHKPYLGNRHRRTETDANNHDYRPRRDNPIHTKTVWEYDVPSEANTVCSEKFEQPMDPKEFKEQCRKSYLEAAAARQRNANMSVWGKCDWATYDTHPPRW